MTALSPDEAVLLGALAAEQSAAEETLLPRLEEAGLPQPRAAAAARSLQERGLLVASGKLLRLTDAGTSAFLRFYGELEAALDPSPKSALQTECPSIPWLTAVKTCWIEAVSVNYAVEPEAVAELLPKPLTPEVHKGSAWVQVLMSSLKDMRPKGVPSLFGVCFYQVSYRAAVRYRSKDGATRHGSFFIRSDTNHELMRAIGNALAEFKFHHFGRAKMVMARERKRLVLGVDPEPGFEGGKLFGMLDVRTSRTPPEGSKWESLEELHEPLVECYDAFGVDQKSGYIYILTIDREPWRAKFIRPENLYSEYFDSGPLGGGSSSMDSVLYVPRCHYRWRPLRREPL